jgi:glyoxylase-like metal-dependent hydrolase (beta-lactamase superfamily II)
MERRAILKSMALIGIGTAIPFKKLLAGMATWTPTGRPFHRVTLGELQLTIITDGHLELKPVQETFPNGSEVDEQRLLREHFRPTTSVDLGMNILVIKKGEQQILIDTGTGNGFGAGSGWLLSSMADAGIQPADITQVVISHAHPDHIGGLLTNDGKPVFANAQIYLSRLEHAFWMAAEQDFTKCKFPDKKLLQVFAANTKKTLTTLQSRIHLFEHKAELFGCLRMEIAPGHTPGHTVTHIFSGNEEIVHIADLMHSDVLLFPHPEWGFNGDTDLELATATRKQVLQQLASTETKVFAYHLPWPGLGRVKIKDDAYEWIAETYAYPY